MKRISVVIPCYNEENCVDEMYQRLTAVFAAEPEYDYEIIYVDDCSRDKTRDRIELLCRQDKRVRAVFNARNFGFSRNVFQSLQYASGDAAFLLFGDLQDPPEMLPTFLRWWESGKKVVAGQRRKSEEGFVMRLCRRAYYRMIDALADTPQIDLFNGFGLYDRCFLDVIAQIDEVAPFFKTVVGEYGMDLVLVPYDHAKSRRGRSNFNFLKNYDFAMQGLTSSTKMLMRLATFVGCFVGFVCLLLSVYVFLNKLLNWDHYAVGDASVAIGIFFLGAVQLFFLGILGEYILSISARVQHKPRVVVARWINFDAPAAQGQNARPNAQPNAQPDTLPSAGALPSAEDEYSAAH